jgi:hypothetical protein
VHPSDTMHLCHNFLNDQLDVSLPTELDFLGLLQLETHRWNKEQIAAMELIQTARCPTRIAFNLELADIHGQVHIFRTIFFGHVTLEDADVHGEANFANSKLCGDLMMRSTKVEGRVFIDESRRHGSSCYPQVRGVLDVSYATLKQVDIKVDPNSIESSPKLVILAGADIESFSYEGPIPSKDEAVTGILNYPLFVTEAVNIKTIQIAVANPTNSERRHTTFSPRDTLRHVIWALLCVWVCILWLVNPSALFVLFFGFYFIAMIFILKTNPHDPVSLLDHLQMTYPFSRGYYLLVERLLRSIGDDNKADEVFHMRRVRENSKPVVIPDTDEDRTRMVKERELKEQHIRPKKKLQQFWQWLLHVGMGYGVRTGRLLHIYIFLCFFNTAVFLNPRSVERPTTFVQTRSDQTIFDFRKMKDEVDQSKLKADNPWPSEGFLPDYNQEGKTEWNGWNAMFMSMRVQIPALQLVAENDWTPATRRIIIEYWPNCKWEVFSFADYASLMMILNIILIPLIIAGLTGYIKKRQSMA